MAWVAAHRGSDPQVKVPRASSERRMLDQVLALMAARGFTRAEVWDGEGVGPC
jgi:hypothetical protein